MPKDRRALQQFQRRRELLLERRLPVDHLLRDAGQRGHSSGNPPQRVDELLLLPDDLPAFDTGNAQLDDPVSEVD